MEKQRSLPHALTRIAERPNILHRHSQQISPDNPYCAQLARPLFDAGLELAAITQRSTYASDLHMTHTYRFTLLLRGSMMVRFGDHEHQLSPGRIACCPPGTLFKRWADGVTWWLYFDVSDQEFWQPLKEHGPYIRDHQCPDLLFILLQHLMDLNSGSAHHIGSRPTRESELLDANIPRGLLYARMLLNIIRQECEIVPRSSDSRVNRLHALVQEIRLAPHHEWHIDDMSQRIHVSRRTLRRLTMSEYNMSPRQLVIQARLDEAVRQLKRGDNSVMSVAHHVGYESVYSFTRLFTKHMGRPPGRYRDEVLKKKTRA